MQCDVALVGAGHNALAAAAYLARAGLRTRVFERRPLVGGACVSEELWPGYRISRGAYVAGLLRPALLRELDLARHGLALIPREPASYTPWQGGPGLLLGRDAAANRASIARYSPRDAARFGDYEGLLDRTARLLEPLLDAPPLDPLRPGARDLALLARLARGAFRARADLPRALALLLGSARGALEHWFDSEPLRGTLATDAVIGAWAGPSSPGSGYMLFHHAMGETGGARGVWAYVRGGMGGFSEALASAARAAGAEIEVDAPVRRILVEAGRVRGLELEDGRSVEAPCVVSGADPAQTYLRLVGASALPEEFAREVRALDFRSPSLKINLALDHLPAFRGASQPGGPESRGTIHLGAQTLDELDAAFAAAGRGELPERPMIELTLPSLLDPTLAPAGHHVASLFVQFVPHALGARDWDALRDPFADRVLALVDEAAPGFAAAVVEREVLAPPDLEHVFGLTGGNLFHGAMGLDRLGPLRAVPRGAGYRGPFEGLYACGAGTHPGGGVMGACGRNAAREILRDWNRRRAPR